jgi:UDP-N-acetylmuramyl pentapeptide phosphotransferase/UDP-N-acetylglucosamine-1-phosphate transferase
VYLPASIGFIVGFVVTRIMVSLAPRFGLLDRPNERSMHTYPVATGGGLGIVLGVSASVGALVLVTRDPPASAGALCIASLLLLILIRDEQRAFGWITKLSIQLVSAGVVTWGASEVIISVWGNAVPAWAAIVICFAVLVYSQNVYNFMDGLDGLSALEAVLVGGILHVLLAPVSAFLSVLSLSISASSLGFLIWNVPPARIFMGDLGAHFLGLLFVWIAISGAREGIPVHITLLPLGCFIYDSTFTLIRRLLLRESLVQPHRFHLYQRLIRSGVSAIQVDGVYAVWTGLFGLAALSVQHQVYQVPALGSAIVFTLGMTVITEYRWMRVAEAD